MLGGLVAALGYVGMAHGLFLAPLLVLIVGFGIIGFIDDYLVPKYSSKRGLGWLPKLVLQVLVVAVFCSLFAFSSWSLWSGFFILFFANAVNFADGLDALAASLLIVALMPFTIYFAMGGFNWAIVCAALVGALLPFLVANAPPALVFMGDLGALSLGGLYGYIFAQSPWQSVAWPWVTSVIFILELVFVPMQIASVKTLRRRIFPATPIHHGFEKMGWPESRVLWVFLSAQIALSAFSLSEVTS